jgi:threonine/homoserine/homoserine lactone efflux protein
MLVTFIVGIITGFIVSVPPLGPISFALISKGFKSEFKEGMSIAFGSAFMDFVYAMIAFGGISLFISLLPDSVAGFYSENVDSIRIILIYSGCIIVVIYGIKIMRSKITIELLEYQQGERLQSAEEKAKAVKERASEFAKQHRVKVAGRSNHGGLFLIGVMLCLSSITLPASWIALVGYIKSFGIINRSIWGGLLFSAGAFLGTTFWFYTLLKLITGNKHRINYSTVNKLNTSAGVILLLLGVFFFFRATGAIFHIF